MTQQQALDILKTGSNVYLTGSAGSGKTYVLSQFVAYLKQQNKHVGITASTGVAATHLNGITINSWAGIGIKQVVSDAEIMQLLRRPYLRKRLKNADVLIIDEVSMLPSYTLEIVSRICQKAKQHDAPFGGMQVVLCGDFFQLPPVNTSSKREETANDFIYKSPLWKALSLTICYLDKPYRQDDERLLHLLKEIRENNVSKETWQILKERFITPLGFGITPTKLYTHNERADAINASELAKIRAEQHIYQMRASGDEQVVNMMKKNCLAPETLILKKGALVMFVKNNMAEGYVNGTLGRVVGISDRDGSPMVETFYGKRVTAFPTQWEFDEDGKKVACITQIPLRLAWAITIHKSQGMSLDAAEIDLGKSFVEGLGYVALSRVRSLSGIRLKSINRTALSVNEEVIAVDRQLRKESDEIAQALNNDYWYQKNAKAQ